MIETTQDIDFETALNKMGLSLKWSEPTQAYLGVDWDWIGDRAVVRQITLDSPAYKAGINAGDEILFLNGLRFLKEDAERLSTMVRPDETYDFIISRLGKLTVIPVLLEKAPKEVKEITIVDRALAEKSFKLSH